MPEKTIITQPIDDPLGNLINVDGDCYIKTGELAGGINHVLMTDKNKVMNRSVQLTKCSREVPGEDVTTPDQVSTSNLKSVTAATKEYGDPRCIDILNESCHYGLSECNDGTRSNFELHHPLAGLTYFSTTYQTTTSGFKHVSIKVNDQWITVLAGDTPAPDLIETHWVDFITGKRYHGNNQQIHDLPEDVPVGNFWKLGKIQAFRFELINNTNVSLPLFRVYNVLLRQGEQRTPMLSKPIRIQYAEL